MDNKRDEWTCEHEHTKLVTAAQCAQLHVNRICPDTTTPVSKWRFRAIHADLLFKDPGVTGVEWVTAEFWYMFGPGNYA
jgi:hypothetical protein